MIRKIQMEELHENVIEVIDHGWLISNEAYYIDMELCAFSLREFILQNVRTKLGFQYLDRSVCSNGVSSLSFWTIITHVTSGLTFIHEKGECHRDLKPENSNLFFSQGLIVSVLFSMKTATWKITDFGLTTESASSKAYSSEYGQGSIGYRAPELVSEFPKFSKSSDVFSLGCIIYELLFDNKLFPTTFSVFNYRSGGCLPTFPDIELYGKSRQFLNLVLLPMLEVNWWRRPAARDIANSLESFSKNSTDIYYVERVEQSPKDPEQLYKVTLSSDDPRWDDVQWYPYW